LQTWKSRALLTTICRITAPPVVLLIRPIIALSDVMLLTVTMAQIIAHTAENTPPDGAALSHGSGLDIVNATPPALPANLDGLAARLGRGGEFRQHSQGLRQRLETLCRLVPAPECFAPPPGSADRRALHHRLCVGNGRTRNKGQLRVDDRAPAILAHLELCPARHAALSQGSAHRHRDGRHSQHSRVPSPAEGSGDAAGSHRQAGDAGQGNPARLARIGRCC
jgi:hypothetical protein